MEASEREWRCAGISREAIYMKLELFVLKEPDSFFVSGSKSDKHASLIQWFKILLLNQKSCKNMEINGVMCLEPMLNFWKIPLSFHISTSYILVSVGEDGWGGYHMV